MDSVPQEGPRELSEEEKKALMKGQTNYLLLMTLSLTAFILGQNATYTCNFADRNVDFYPNFDVDAACAEGDFTDLEEQVCRTFLDHQ